MRLEVVAAVLRDPQGRVLLAQRPEGKHLAGTWEFPGGKLEPTESAAAALERELEEELGIRVRRSSPLLSLTHAYPEKTVRLRLREVQAWDGDPHSREGQPIAWFDLDAMQQLPMPAADRPMCKALSLDARYAISPDPARSTSLTACLEDWEARLAAGYRWLQLRAQVLPPAMRLQLASACGQLARRYGARWLIYGDVELAEQSGADGVHLDAAELGRCKDRPLPESRLVCASCHKAEDLARAGQLGLDFVTLSPVLPTASHSPAKALGWAEFERLCALSPLPVLALGGIGPEDLAQARECGAFGVAGVSAFGRHDTL
ncbi:MAG: Nudix family hydrolase [Wenzhouxiangella sp.]